jgi:hypothetical protein
MKERILENLFEKCDIKNIQKEKDEINNNIFFK